MFSVNELMEQIDCLKQSREMITNNFLSLSDMEKMAKNEESKLAYNEKAIALFCNDNGVHRIYFNIASMKDIDFLTQLLPQYGQRPLVADCIGKKPQLDAIERALCDIGFETYVHMSRWRTSHINYLPESKLQFMHDSDNFRKAELEDTEEIYRILYDTFDPVFSQLPTKEFLMELIKDGLVFCALMKGKIAAVECMQKVGRNGIYCYELAVIPKYRNSGVGCYVWQYAVSHFPECRNFTSWTDNRNTASNHLHEMLGFAYDGLLDYVLLLR